MGANTIPRRSRDLVLALVLFAYIPFALDGCVSIKLAPRGAAVASPAPAAGGSFRFLAVRKARERGRESAAASGVMAALFRVVGEEEQVVWRQVGGDWTVGDLPPGAYCLHVERVMKDGGLEEPSGELASDVTIRAGEQAQANVVLQKTPWGLVVALSLTVVFLVALLVILAQSGDIDLPSADLSGIAPPIPPLSPELVEIGLDFVVLGGELAGDDDEEYGGVVLGATPEDGAADVDQAAAVDVTLSGEVDPLGVDQRTFGLFTEGRQLPAAIAVRDHGRKLHLVPLSPLPAGAKVTARLMGSHVALAQRDGTLEENYEWSFEVAPE